jgi:hypothetical protein
MSNPCDRTDHTKRGFVENYSATWTISLVAEHFRSTLPGTPPEFTNDSGLIGLVTTDVHPGEKRGPIDICHIIGRPIQATETAEEMTVYYQSSSAVIKSTLSAPPPYWTDFYVRIKDSAISTLPGTDIPLPEIDMSAGPENSLRRVSRTEFILSSGKS